ncbi:MAG: glycosyltransferase family 1 protein [Nitrospinaceae bacterium]
MRGNRLIEMTRAGGRRGCRFLMNHYSKIKPLFAWLSPQTRNRLKAFFFGWAFRNFYTGSTPGTPSPAAAEISLKGSPLPKGVNLIGYPCAEIGEGEFLRQAAQSFSSREIPFGIYDHGARASLGRGNQQFARHIRPDNRYSTNLFHVKPDQLESTILSLGPSFIEHRYNIGYWVWELSEFPDAWKNPLNFLDEVWCPSRFIQAAVEKKSDKPAVYQPLAVELEIPTGFDRAYFGLPPAPFIFLFAFDFKSCFPRKNPIACIDAFQRAFPRGGEPAALVIKSMDGALFPRELQTLTEACQRDRRVIHIDALFQSDEILGLMQVCDSFISLHRSEGIGLCLAQSMLLGKPVLATGYSGNTDFMHPNHSCLVNYRLVPVKAGEYPHGEGQVWADPDVDHAAGFMRRLVNENAYRHSIAEAGRSYIRSRHNAQTIGRGYQRRLEELGLL